MIKLGDPYYDQREIDAVSQVLKSGWLTSHKTVEEFENKLAEFCGTRYCVCVSSGTAALHLLFHMYDKCDVLIPNYTFKCLYNILDNCNFNIKFVNVGPDYNMIVDEAVQHIKTGNYKIVVPVHQFGWRGELPFLQTYSADIIEDAACSMGCYFDGQDRGIFGKAAILSFHPRKVITTGEGGAIITNDYGLAEELKKLRNHGYVRFKHGFNYRMTEMQAALGIVQLSKIYEIMEKRKTIIKYYLDNIDQDICQLPPYINEDVNIQTLFVIFKKKIGYRYRETIKNYFHNKGIEIGDGTTPPIPMISNGYALPLHPNLSKDDVQKICKTIEDL